MKLLNHWRVFAAAAAALVIVVFVYLRVYASPAAELRAQIASSIDAASRMSDASDDLADAERRLRDIGATTLGREPDLVRHRLRVVLADLAEKSGLAGVEVSERGPAAVPSPAIRAGVRGELRERLRARADFGVVHAEVSGAGSLDACLATLDTIQAQPWAHRVGSFSIRPDAPERDRFALRVALSTLYLPDVADEDPPEAVEPDRSRVLALASASPILRPAPPTPAPAPIAQRDPTPAAPPPPAWDRWRVTGVIEAPSGVEVMVSRSDTDAWRTIRPGDSVLEAQLVEASGEHAVFEIAGSRYRVATGSTLAERVPAD